MQVLFISLFMAMMPNVMVAMAPETLVLASNVLMRASQPIPDTQASQQTARPTNTNQQHIVSKVNTGGGCMHETMLYSGRFSPKNPCPQPGPKAYYADYPGTNYCHY